MADNPPNIMAQPPTALQIAQQMEQRIAMMDGQLIILSSTDMSKSTTTRFMTALYNEMSKQGIGKFGKYIGRIGISISDQFWSDEVRANRIVTNLVSSFKRMYELFQGEFGEDADQIFADNFFQTRFTV